MNERFSLIKYYFQADSVTKPKCIKLCEENYWMASLPNVNDFDWLREQFVDKEYFQIAGGISFRKQLKHIGGKQLLESTQNFLYEIRNISMLVTDV